MQGKGLIQKTGDKAVGRRLCSTSSGLLTDRQAESRDVGGEVLAYVW